MTAPVHFVAPHYFGAGWDHRPDWPHGSGGQRDDGWLWLRSVTPRYFGGGQPAPSIPGRLFGSGAPAYLTPVAVGPATSAPTTSAPAIAQPLAAPAIPRP